MTLLHRAALLAVIALLVVFGLFRIDPIDVPEHLAVGRVIWEQGAPMTTNALSWTFPDAPNHQQYPLYQLILYGLESGLGFWSLSVFCCLTWTGAGLAWLQWGGGLAMAQRTSFVWLLGVLGVQRHLVARPEVFTLLGLAVLLLAFEAWRDTRRPGPLVAMVVTLWVMVNTHQMYVIGLVLVAGFLVHVAATRALRGRGWVDESDADLPLLPLGLTLAAGLGAVALSPLGVRAWTAPLALLSTVQALGTGGSLVESDELAPVWADPIAGPVAVLLGSVIVVQGVRSRGRWQVLELGVLAMGVGMVALALRGIPFFALAASAVATRWHARAPRWSGGALVPTAMSSVTFVLAASLGLMLLIPRPHVYLQRQQGIGRSVGEWGDDVVRFLTTAPPPGEMLNIGWVAANYLNYGVYPVKRVFVDGRWEAYPMDFLVDCMQMQRSQAVLDELIEAWQPGFVVAEMRDPDQLDRLAHLAARGWSVVHVDSIAAVAVAPSPAPEVQAYVAEHGLALRAAEVPDWLPDHPILHAQQQARVAGLLERLGASAEAAPLWEAARAHRDHPAVADDLERFSP